MKKIKRTAVQLLVLSSLVITPFALPQTVEASTSTKAINEYDVFLRDKFNISISNELSKVQYIKYTADIYPAEVDQDAIPTFTQLDAKSPYLHAAAELFQQGIIDSTTLNEKEQLTPQAATLIAVRAAGLTELAQTYSKDKVNVALKKIDSNYDKWLPHVAQQLAVAIDAGLVETSFLPELKTNRPASASFAQSLLVQVASYTGQYKNYLGLTTDADIVKQVVQAYNSSNIIQVEELQKIVDTALEKEAITGYNFKDSRFNSNFVDDYTITYGHANVKHAIQLINLLRSEGIEAKVQLEPKTSAFLYLAEWGNPEEAEDFQVQQISNGNYIAYAKEYDIAFEFETLADREKFQSIILAYAKKDAEDEAGLIYGSWWQPLYYSNSDIEDYVLISNNKITHGNYYAQSFSLNEQVEDIVKGIKAVDANAKVENYQFWANVAFYNYLGGTDYK